MNLIFYSLVTTAAGFGLGYVSFHSATNRAQVLPRATVLSAETKALIEDPMASDRISQGSEPVRTIFLPLKHVTQIRLSPFIGSTEFKLSRDMVAFLNLTPAEESELMRIMAKSVASIFHDASKRLKLADVRLKGNFDTFTLVPLSQSQGDVIRGVLENDLRSAIGEERATFLGQFIAKFSDSNPAIFGFGTVETKIEVNQPPAGIPFSIRISLDPARTGGVSVDTSVTSLKLPYPWSSLLNEASE